MPSQGPFQQDIAVSGITFQGRKHSWQFTKKHYEYQIDNSIFQVIYRKEVAVARVADYNTRRGAAPAAITNKGEMATGCLTGI
jgi:hypothetical protein